MCIQCERRAAARAGELASSDRMTDSTLFGSSLTFGGSSGFAMKKRKIGDSLSQVGQASSQSQTEIKDVRIKASEGLRLDTDLISVRVGPPEIGIQETFQVHEGAICDRSEFFRNAMKPEWATMRPDPRVVELPDDDPEAFSLYHKWLYSGYLPVIPDDEDTDSSSDSYHTLAYAYVLGERLMDVPFKNCIADAYVLYARGMGPAKRFYPTNEEIKIIYEGTTDKSPLRKLLVDIWYCRGRVEWVEKDPDLPQEFLTEVVKKLLGVRMNVENLSRPWKNNHEQYHENV